VEAFIQLGVLVAFVLLGLIAGRFTEGRHLKSMAQREASYEDVLVSDLRSFPEARSHAPPPQLVVAEVVIATDYLKVFLTSFRILFGGELKSYRSLMTRARREALLRLMEQARSAGYNALANVRLEGADIGGSALRRGMMMVSILASATAYHAEARPRLHPYRSPG
jgi:uncharacterized protein YbjQ (UPF0145 family)